MADLGFDNKKYWAERNLIKKFREQWYEWRNECKELYGAQYVNLNKHLFTQAAFANYLQEEMELQAKEEAERQLQLPAPPPPSNELKPVSEDGSNVVVMNIDGSPEDAQA